MIMRIGPGSCVRFLFLSRALSAPLAIVTLLLPLWGFADTGVSPAGDPRTELGVGLESVDSEAGISQQNAAPRFVYAPGAQGYTYYAAPAAPRQPAATTNRPRTVGPGARNWATGNRVPLHRPWLSAK